MLLLLLFILVPLIEIALFIQIGGWLTLWPTLAIVLATAFLGAWLVRIQGVKVLTELQESLQRGGDPLSPMAHGALILLSGALLVTPGFFTDAVGFLLLVPTIRSGVLRWLGRRGLSRLVVVRAGGAPDDDIIDAEFTELSPDAGDDAPSSTGGGKHSGWTRH